MPKATPMTSSATGPADDATSAAAIGGPTIVAMTYPFESTALTRSHSGSGTMIGKSERSPTWLRIEVNEETTAMRTSSGPGSASRRARTAMKAIATSATT